MAKNKKKKKTEEPTPETAWRIEYLIRTITPDGILGTLKGGYSCRTADDAKAIVAKEVKGLESQRMDDGSLMYKKVKLLRTKIAEVSWEEAMAAEPIEEEDNPVTETFENGEEEKPAEEAAEPTEEPAPEAEPEEEAPVAEEEPREEEAPSEDSSEEETTEEE